MKSLTIVVKSLGDTVSNRGYSPVGHMSNLKCTVLSLSIQSHHTVHMDFVLVLLQWVYLKLVVLLK
jgi:hypothetical protein